MHNLRKDAGMLFTFSRNVITINFFSEYSILVTCRHDIEFIVQNARSGYTLYELDGNASYFLADNLDTISDVYERMCEEHGCLR